MKNFVRSIAFFAASGLVVTVAACSSKSSDPGPAGGAVAGALDTHCGSTSTPVDPATCHAATTGDDAGSGDDAGASAGDDAGADPGTSDYGPTEYNSEADDDDCKYHVKWTSTPIRENTDVTFTVTSTNKAGGAPTTGAAPRLEIYLSDTHPAPNSKQQPTETSPGVYDVGPVRFDAPGRWTVRFHFSEDCNDGENSPHGHAAFYVDVP